MKKYARNMKTVCVIAVCEYKITFGEIKTKERRANCFIFESYCFATSQIGKRDIIRNIGNMYLKKVKISVLRIEVNINVIDAKRGLDDMAGSLLILK